MTHRNILFESKRISALRTRFPKQSAFLQARFSPEGYLGLQLTVGVLVLICATWFFASLAEDVMEGDPLALTDILLSHGSTLMQAEVNDWMLLVTDIHSMTGISL